MNRQNIKLFVIILIICGVLIAPFFIFKVQAEDDFNYLKIYNSQTLELEKQIPLYKDSMGYNISTLDLGGDGQSEILISAGPDSLPWVKILTGNGHIINEILA